VDEGVRVSIIMVTWNCRDLALRALDALEGMADEGAQVIVVDNASSDGTADTVAARPNPPVVIRSGENLGFAGGVNLGVETVLAPYVLLLNPDVVMRGGVLDGLLEYIDLHEDVAVVGPRVLNPDGSLQVSRRRFPSLIGDLFDALGLARLFPRSAFFNRSEVLHPGAGEAQDVDWLSGCCFLLRRQTFEDVGGFDPDFFMYAEETDFCLRARQAGWRVCYVPSGDVMHDGGGSTRKARARMQVEYRRSMLRFYRKHGGHLTAEVARIFMLLFVILRIPYWSVRAAVGASTEGSPASEQLRGYLAVATFLFGSVEGRLRRSNAPDPKG